MAPRHANLGLYSVPDLTQEYAGLSCAIEKFQCRTPGPFEDIPSCCFAIPSALSSITWGDKTEAVKCDSSIGSQSSAVWRTLQLRRAEQSILQFRWEDHDTLQVSKAEQRTLQFTWRKQNTLDIYLRRAENAIFQHTKADKSTVLLTGDKRTVQLSWTQPTNTAFGWAEQKTIHLSRAENTTDQHNRAEYTTAQRGIAENTTV